MTEEEIQEEQDAAYEAQKEENEPISSPEECCEECVLRSIMESNKKTFCKNPSCICHMTEEEIEVVENGEPTLKKPIRELVHELKRLNDFLEQIQEEQDAKCCELCRPNSLEIKNGLNTCRQTMCGCHFSFPPKEPDDMNQEKNGGYKRDFQV